MNKKILSFALTLGILSTLAFAQTKEELNTQKAEKAAQVAELQSQIDGIKGEISAIDAQLIEFPRWEAGAFGSVGLNFNGFNQWVSRDQANIASSTIGVAMNAYANNFTKKTFWRNGANVNMGWIKFDDKDNPDDVPEYQKSADAINITSLYGYKFNEKLAASALGEYRSTILSNFNNPGYLDIGLGATWTPVPNLVVVVHPLNQNFVFADENSSYESSMGAKIVADYTKELVKGFNWKSNLSVFQSYKGSELSNWTWINSVAFSIAKGFGVGAELGLRQNRQEITAFNEGKAAIDQLENGTTQVYYVIGLSYSISAKK